jgi:hypothetical protein
MASDGKQVPSGTKRARERSEGTDRSNERRGNWEGKSRANKNEKWGGETTQGAPKRIEKESGKKGEEVARRLADSNSQLGRKGNTEMEHQHGQYGEEGARKGKQIYGRKHSLHGIESFSTVLPRTRQLVIRKSWRRHRKRITKLLS